jgi:tripartite-type tricarboxylate transporter receptor subunit TctC
MVLSCIGGSRRRFARGCIGAGLALAAMLTALPGAGAQDYPSRPVKIIVPFPAGGTADVMPRVIGEWLSRKWGQPVVVENRTGAAGNIGAEAVAKAEPDGYTLLSAPPPPLVINQNLYPKLGFDPTEFVPIVIMGRVPNALVINAKLPFNSVAELIAYAKANPGKLTSATQGNGTTSHLTSELFQLMADVKFQHVPYRGSAPALTDLVAGSVDLMFDNLGVSLPLVKGGQLKLLGVATPSAWRRCRTCRRSRKRCPASNRRRGSRSWRRRRRRRPSSTRSTPTSTKRCARATSFSASRNSRPNRSAARPRRRPPICAKRSSAGTRSSRPPT